MQSLNYIGEELHKKLQSETHVTLKHGRGYQTWYELVALEQGYNEAMSERLHFNSVREKVNLKFSV